MEGASQESLDALRQELEEEQGRLQRRYGKAQGGEQQREIKRQIRNVAAQSGPVGASIMFHQDGREHSSWDGGS